MKKYKLVIFDMDGTILDTLTDITDSVNHVMRSHSLKEHDYTRVRGYVGSGARTLFERALGTDVDPELLDSCVSDFKIYYKNHCQDKTSPYEGIPELLKKLHDIGYKLAVVSNKPDESVKVLVDKYFDNIFDYALGESDKVAKKPAPDMVNLCLEYFGLSKDEAIYIGDSDVDYMTSINSGLDQILVTWGFKDFDFLKTFNAMHYVNKPEEILAVLQ